MEQRHRLVLLGLIVLALLAPSVTPEVHARAGSDPAALQLSATPLESLLNVDGTLDLSTGFSGSLDLRGWSMTLADDGTPHFSRPGASDRANTTPASRPASVPDDDYWDGRFDYPPGVGGADPHVVALAVSGSDLYVGGTFTTTGSVSGNNIAKWNPANGWSPLGNGVNNGVGALVVSGSNLYAGGDFTQLCGNPTCDSGNTTASHIAQWNGSSWSALGNGVSSYVSALAVSGSAVYAGGWFTQVCGNPTCSSGNTSANRIAQWNGSTWSALGNGVNSYVWALAVSGGNVYAAGAFSQVCGNPTCDSGNTTASHTAQWNGSSWSALGNGVNDQVHALAVSGSTVYAGGWFTQVCGNPTCDSGNLTVHYIAQWNGSTWSAIGNGVNWPVLALAVSGGNVYAGGEFSQVCGNPTCDYGNTEAKRIAQWNGSTWSPLGNGVTGSVLALAVSRGDVYAGGMFTSLCGNAACDSGSTTVNSIAQWNGSTWSPLGSGADDNVWALAVSGGNVYAGGGFTSIGGVVANRIAAWKGYVWSPLGNGVHGDVTAVAVSGGNVYAGGWFSQVCGNADCNSGNSTVNHIAVWNGSTWSALGNGVNGNVWALAVSGSTVYAGGGFSQLCGNATCDGGNTIANRIAVWNGSSWSPLGNGMNNAVSALTVSGSSVYAGGNFTQVCGDSTCAVGNTTVNNFARWNGSSWSALGNGVNGAVYALAVSGSTVYAGGRFTQVCGNAACNSGNAPVNSIARWNGSTWSPLGSGMNSPVDAMSLLGTDVYVGGMMTAAGGKPSFHFAHWSKPPFLYLPMIEK